MTSRYTFRLADHTMTASGALVDPVVMARVVDFAAALG
jgi:hypothetical protein